MSGANIYRKLKELLPAPPLMVATVASISTAQGTSTVSHHGGGSETVRGTSVPVGMSAFVRNGLIEGPAPDLTMVTIEV